MPFEVGTAEYFVADFPEVSLFNIIDTNCNNAIIAKHISSKQQAGIHHGAPVGVVSSIALRILY